MKMKLKCVAAKVAEQYDNFYLYDESGVAEQIETLKKTFPSAELLYSVKCNPNRRVLDAVFQRGLGADVASVGEVVAAREAGLSRDQIYFSAPGKTTADVAATLDEAVLIADSLAEIERIDRVAAELGRVAEIGIRVNPNFAFDGGAAQASKFGVDEDQAVAFLTERAPKNVRVVGLHIHLRSQELDADVLARYHRGVVATAERLAEIGVRLEFVNLGAGIGIPYAKTDEAVDLAALGEATEREIARFRERFPNVRFLLESGRFIVGGAGIYVTTVLDRKTSRGRTFLIVKNTLNGFLRPSLARLIERCVGKDVASHEPLFTKADAFEIVALKDDGGEIEREEATVVGNLCTATDVIAEKASLPRLEPGDAITISNAGAYGVVLSPTQFSSQEKPVELFLRLDGNVVR